MNVMTMDWELERMACASRESFIPVAAALPQGYGRAPVADPRGPILRGQLDTAISMKKHVSWRAGGVAARTYRPADLADLAAFLQGVPETEAVCFVGLGSNLLVRDGGYRGTIVFLHGALNTLHVDGDTIYAEAGVASPKVARFAAMHGLAGAEFLAGIPGAIGGALAMNAGCYGSETWERVDKVQTIDRHGVVRVRAPSDYDIGYRHVATHDAREEWFVGAWFRFAPGDEATARARIRELLTKRIASQPLELPNAGSVFRNPPGDYAARLIEASGLKGYAVGGARVSEKHANFIVNQYGTASARDIEALINHVRATVKRQHGVDLVPEVRIIGDNL